MNLEDAGRPFLARSMVQLKHRCRSFIVGPPTCCGVLDPYCGPGEGSGAQRTHGAEPWWLFIPPVG